MTKQVVPKPAAVAEKKPTTSANAKPSPGVDAKPAIAPVKGVVEAIEAKLAIGKKEFVPVVKKDAKKDVVPPTKAELKKAELKVVPVATSDVRSSNKPAEAQGLTLSADGEASFTVWAPHAAAAFLRIESPALLVPLDRTGDNFSVRLNKGYLKHGDRYRVELDAYNTRLLRRDPFARATDYDTDWCYVQDDTAYEWKVTDWKRPEFAEYTIYELHVGSFTEEGTFAAAIDKLQHVADMGFTCVQCMPILEHSDDWGYNPRQFFSMHGGYGTPDEFKAFVDAAHKLGIAVIIDVVLHHASVLKNALWEYDGWSEHNNGGVYFEGSADTEWGRSLAYWKMEVMDMLCASAAQWLSTYRCDGLRFDSANDLPHDVCRQLTAAAHTAGPGSYLTAEVTPENPKAVHELGFDALWVHSGYFDIIHQHRALGRGHHGGNEYAAGWDFPRLRTVMGLHYGFTSPTQCIKYVLGSHDQVGCKNGGAIYEDYKMIGGQHRYSCDQFGAGRDDPWARSASRAWWAANAAAAGIPMLFMGTEWNQTAWWDTWGRKPTWALSQDTIGSQMGALVKDTLAIRKQYIALRIGGTNTLHEDRGGGILAVDRCWESERVVVVINAGREFWCNGEYRVWVGGAGYSLRQVLNSGDEKYGGWSDQKGNGTAAIPVYDGFVNINVPPQSTMIFVCE